MREGGIDEVRNQISNLRAKLDSVTAHVITGQCVVQKMPFVPMSQYSLPVSRSCYMWLL